MKQNMTIEEYGVHRQRLADQVTRLAGAYLMVAINEEQLAARKAEFPGDKTWDAAAVGATVADLNRIDDEVGMTLAFGGLRAAKERVKEATQS